MRIIIITFVFLVIQGCSTYLLDGQDFASYQKPIPIEANLISENNVDLHLIEVSSLSPDVLDSMPKMSGAKIPPDLKNISFNSNFDNSIPEYVIGPGDIVEIFFPIDENVNNITSRGLRVNGRGEIDFPYLGKYRISGFTEAESEELLEIALSNLYVDPKINLTVKEFKSNRVFISGSFSDAAPGASSPIGTRMITLDNIPTTIVQALHMSGVSFSEASPNPFLILKRDNHNHIVDLGFIKNNANPNIFVKSNDFIYLPSSAPQKIYVTGAVSSDQILSFGSTMTLSEALLQSNINKSLANLREIYVLRVNQTSNNKLKGIAYKVDIKSPSNLMAADKFYLLDKDIIFVSANKIARWNATISRMLTSLDFIKLWESYKPINSEVFRTQ